MSSLSTDFKRFSLFGYPVLHSTSPAFHNAIFGFLGEGKSCDTFSTSQVFPEMHCVATSLAGLVSPDKAERRSSVTKPVKGLIIPHLDGITPEVRATGAVNTIVKVEDKLVGTNTDILGVKNALLRGLRLQHPGTNISPQGRYPAALRGAGLVIGGGATTRSAAHALATLGLHPIYLVNRDVAEVEAVQMALPHLTLVHLRHPDQVEELLAQPTSPRILMIVGAIPAFAPVTPAERMVYTTASSILSIPYTPPELPSDSTLSLPKKRLFLEMAYKPRITPMLRIAAAHGWDPIDGIQAMIEQGYAQQRM
ncbi:hypothetical protein DFH07DRAFT_969503 [Mycena maculata]|uniref:Shikimate dehydrogenase substrate binding N-terminal domain-containing protein n=1 Tax=Mycena maculata TaxID=230809 RepID=A0AAD7HXJ9_9AGAR|nr:hypothetical protein DFH07DRAFT_969503 [Mycena maculata]